MRSSKSRSRGNKNRNLRPTGGNIINRVFDSSGPDGKVRGTPAQIIEKYTQLHRDAQLAGDRVGAENFAQHAEHYTRLLAEATREIDRAREEQEQFNRERQAERDREMQREREARAERDAQRQGQQGQQGQPNPQSDRDRDRDREREANRERDRERDREANRERDRERERERERDRERDRDRARYRPVEDQPAATAEQPTGLPAFLTHGFAQSPSSIEESGLGSADMDAGGDSGLVETPEMRDLTPQPARPPRTPRPPRAERKPDPAPEPAPEATEPAAADKPRRTRKPKPKAEDTPADGNGQAEAAE